MNVEGDLFGKASDYAAVVSQLTISLPRLCGRIQRARVDSAAAKTNLNQAKSHGK